MFIARTQETKIKLPNDFLSSVGKSEIISEKTLSTISGRTESLIIIFIKKCPIKREAVVLGTPYFSESVRGKLNFRSSPVFIVVIKPSPKIVSGLVVNTLIENWKLAVFL